MPRSPHAAETAYPLSLQLHAGIVLEPAQAVAAFRLLVPGAREPQIRTHGGQPRTVPCTAASRRAVASVQSLAVMAGRPLDPVAAPVCQVVRVRMSAGE